MTGITNLTTEALRLAAVQEKAEAGDLQALRELDEGRADLNADALDEIETLLTDRSPFTAETAEGVATVLRAIGRPISDSSVDRYTAMPAFTVIGVYEDGPAATYQRFAEVFRTDEGPRGAEQLAEEWACEQHDEGENASIIVAGVVRGSVGMVDALEPSGELGRERSGQARHGGRIFEVAVELRRADVSATITRRVLAGDAAAAERRAIEIAEWNTALAGWKVSRPAEMTEAQ